MPGLNLGMSAGFLTPPAALPPSYAGSVAGGGATISSRAYGIGAAGTNPGTRRTAALGATSTGTVCLVALAWLWWTLPR